jgi:N-formylglutamate amidohydrolase
MPQRWAAPLVLSSPHSGTVYPPAFLASARLDPHTLRKSEDTHVDALMEGAADLGVPLVAARFPRAYLDVNREPYELDPHLFHERLPDFVNTQSVRVVGGLGTIARIVSESEEIYRERLRVSDAFERIDRLYRPYHAMLSRLMDEAHAGFGYAVLIDCHSMPSVSTGTATTARPDIVLGDRFGAACQPALMRLAREAFTDAGFRVVMNRPYAGGYITEHYGQPQRGRHAVQVEVNRALYMNEETFERSTGFEACRAALTDAVRRIMVALSVTSAPRQAAE